jgi:hypothetical protein
MKINLTATSYIETDDSNNDIVIPENLLISGKLKLKEQDTFIELKNGEIPVINFYIDNIFCGSIDSSGWHNPEK